MALRYFFNLIFVASVFNFGVANAQLTTNQPLPRFQRHFVRERETPSSIASDFNIKTKDFLMLNNFPPDVKLKPGQEVLIRVLKDGENPPKESAYVPKKAAEEPVKVAEEPVQDKEPEYKAAAREVTSEKREPVNETVMENHEPKKEKVEKPAPAPKKTAVVKDVSPDMLVGPNGAKYEMTSGNFHVVQKGQTFYHIAMMYHLSIDELKKLNNLTTTDIKVGQELKVSK